MRQDYRLLVLDLDGTLTDPMVGITKSVQYALKHYGIEENDLKKHPVSLRVLQPQKFQL